jgi:outer membrane protein assembly factor BamB
VLANGAVYFMSEHTGWRTYALSAETGEQLWNITTPTAKAVTASAVLANSRISKGVYFGVLLGSNKVRIVRVDAATGVEVWNVPAPGENLYGPPTVAGGLVYIILTDGLYAFNAASGAVAWSATKPGCSETSPVVVDGVVYVAGGATGGVQSFDATTGKPLWTSLSDTSSPWVSWEVHSAQCTVHAFHACEPYLIPGI